MKILFMGTPDIASGCLQELIDKKYDIIGVVTQPDKQVGRGKKIVFSPVKQVAIENNLPVYQPIKAKAPLRRCFFVRSMPCPLEKRFSKLRKDGTAIPLCAFY